jgi:transposase
MHVEPHHTAEQVAGLIRAEPSAKRARRLSAVRLALLGHPAPAIAAQVLLSERQVRTWVARYNAAGLAGLADRKGRGRKGPLDAEQQQRLKSRLLAGPSPADGCCAFRGSDVRRIPQEEFGVLRCLDAVYALMHRLGLEPLRPRPRHPEGDLAQQEAFKKSSPRPSPRRRRPTPASASRCGSRTRPGSASRGR